MNKITVICPLDEGQTLSERMEHVLNYALHWGSREVERITKASELQSITGGTLLFAVYVSDTGINIEYSRMLDRIRREGDFFPECTGAVLVGGGSDLYTKAIGREMVHTANQAGCTFIGRPLVEGTASLKNFQIQANLRKTDLMAAYHLAARNLIERLTSFAPPKTKRPKLLVLHASNVQTSNTISFWRMVKIHLINFDIREISLRNGQIEDCGGCPYTMCMHFSEKGQCYYGGIMVEDVIPAVVECDALLLLCPNYNDAIGANLSAFVNRLTSLYRKKPFFDKYLYAIIVSGYSGGDLVAEQLISALNMNKAFILPEKFSILETANDPGSIREIPGIEEQAKEFAGRMKKMLQGKLS